MSKEQWNQAFNAVLNSTDIDIFKNFLTKEFVETYGYKQQYKARYQGFDVQLFRAHFYKRCMMLTNCLIWLGPGKTIAASGDKNFNTLIFYLISMLIRGKTIKAIEDGLPEEGKSHWTTLTTMLDIKDEEAKNSTTVTLDRIAVSFPMHAVGLMKEPRYFRKLIDMADVGIEQDSAGTRAIVHPMAGSLLTDDMKQNGWVFITLLSALRRNKITGGSSRGKVEYARLWNVQKAILGWKAVTEDIKREFWKDLKEDVSDDMIKACKKVVSEQVPTDIFQEILEYSGCHA